MTNDKWKTENGKWKMADKTHSPKTLDHTYALLAERKESRRIIAGGTDLMVLMNARLLDASEFIDIQGVEELRTISDESETIRIGALTTYTQLIKSSLIQQSIPPLIDASRTIGAIQIQNRGTIGGNIVNASPAGDTLPVLAAFEAEIEIGSIRGIRRVNLNQLYTGYRKTVLESDELVLAVRVPKLSEGELSIFCKVGTRRAQAISKVVMAAKARMENGRIESISIGLGSVAPTVIRPLKTESLLIKSTLSPMIFEQARQSISEEVKPISDVRSTEEYRRTISGNLLTKFLRQLQGAGERGSGGTEDKLIRE